MAHPPSFEDLSNGACSRRGAHLGLPRRERHHLPQLAANPGAGLAAPKGATTAGGSTPSAPAPSTALVGPTKRPKTATWLGTVVTEEPIRGCTRAAAATPTATVEDDALGDAPASRTSLSRPSVVWCSIPRLLGANGPACPSAAAVTDLSRDGFISGRKAGITIS